MPEHRQHHQHAIKPHELYDYVELRLSDQIRRGRICSGWVHPSDVSVDLGGHVWLENKIDSDVVPAIFDIDKTVDQQYLWLRIETNGHVHIGVPTDRGDIRLDRWHGEEALPVHSVNRDRSRYLPDWSLSHQ